MNKSMRNVKIVKTRCRQCMTECGVLVHVENGRIVKIEGDPEDSASEGVICSKGLAIKELVYHPDRLLYPLKRIGTRSEGKWERISWDKALEIIVNKLNSIKKKYGPEAILFLRGTRRGPWTRVHSRFVNAFGSPNLGLPGLAQCFLPRITASTLTFGGPANECPEYNNTNCMLLWGINPFATWPVKAKRIIDAKARGAKLIVVDPKPTVMASKADVWLRVRPGTDAALALGMLNVIIEEGLYDQEFVKNWCIGFEELRKRVQDYPPKKVEEIIWVSEEDIRTAARMYATTKPASITECVSIDQSVCSLQAARAICILIAITGNVDRLDGNVFPMRAPIREQSSKEFCLTEKLPEDQWEKRLGADRYPLLAGRACVYPFAGAHMPTVWRAILSGKPYPIKATYIQGSNPLLSYPNSNLVKEALEKLEFIIAVDFFITPSAELADIVLPAATWIERDAIVDHLQVSYGDVLFRQKAIEPLGECWSDVKILIELAKKLGISGYFWNNEIEYLDYILEPSGMTFEEFKKKGGIRVPMKYKKYEKDGFNTPSGKVELYSSRLHKLGYDPLPNYVEPPESPISKSGLAEKFPLILTTGGRTVVYFHSELRNIPSLRRIVPEPVVDINSETARRLGIRNGDTVIVESPRGSIKVKTATTPGIHPKVVQIAPGWPGEANINILTSDEKCAPDVGSSPLRGLLCRIRKP